MNKMLVSTARNRVALPILVTIAVALAPLISPTPQHYAWATSGAIWAIWVLGLNIVWGYAGQLSLANFAFGAISAYVSLICWTQEGWPIVLAAGAGVIAAIFVSLILSVAALRLSGFYFAIVTVTCALMVTTIFENWGRAGRTTGLVAPLYQIPALELGPFEWEMGSLEGGFYALCALILVALVAFSTFLLRSPAGRGMVAVRDDERLAQSLGINPLHMKTLAFMFSGGVSGIGGILFGFSFLLVVPEIYGLNQALIAVMLLVLAGRGSLYAPVLGGFIYTLIYQAVPVDGAYRSGILGVIVIAIVLLAPAGLAPTFAAWVTRAGRWHITSPRAAQLRRDES